MTLDPQARLGAHPSIVLSAHIEPIVRGRRVAIFGDATLDLAERLSQRGARLIHAYDPDPARAAEALARSAARRTQPGPHVAYAALEGDLGVRDGAFDVVVVPDLSVFPDPADTLRRARRLVSASGAVVIASPNPDASGRLIASSATGASATTAAPAPLSYYDLYDVVSLQFSVVRMLGQAPFVGYTIADFAPEGEPSVSVDTSLLEATEQPEWFIAIGSERAVTLEEFAVIEIPFADIALTLAPGTQREGADTIEDRLALTESRARLALITAEFEELRERHRTEIRDTEARAQAAAGMSARIVELEAEIEAREARLKESQSRAGDSHVRAERLTHQITELEEELRRQRDRATKLTKQLDDEKKARTKADMELAMIRNRPEIAGAKDRLQELTHELEGARTRIAELEMEHLVTRRIVMTPEEPEPTFPSTEQNLELAARVTDLEIALDDTKRALAEAIAQRDQALSRVQELERASVSADRDRADFDAQRASMKRVIEELTQKSAGLARTVEELQGKCASLEQASLKGGQQRASLEQRGAELEKKCALLEQRGAELERNAADVERQAAELRLRLASADGQRDEAETALAADLSAAEAQLKERGRLIVSLERDLRESRRTGEELIEELEALRVAVVTEAPAQMPDGAPDRQAMDELRARLDTLAARSAKCEADYQAATWRVAQLERELSEARSGSPDPAATQLELEKALAAAREQIEDLRRAAETKAAAEAQGIEGSSATRGAVEQSVLLHQAAGEIGQGS